MDQKEQEIGNSIQESIEAAHLWPVLIRTLFWKHELTNFERGVQVNGINGKDK